MCPIQHLSQIVHIHIVRERAIVWATVTSTGSSPAKLTGPRLCHEALHEACVASNEKVVKKLDMVDVWMRRGW
jgi:hypothetical protein